MQTVPEHWLRFRILRREIPTVSSIVHVNNTFRSYAKKPFARAVDRTFECDGNANAVSVVRRGRYNILLTLNQELDGQTIPFARKTETLRERETDGDRPPVRDVFCEHPFVRAAITAGPVDETRFPSRSVYARCVRHIIRIRCHRLAAVSHAINNVNAVVHTVVACNL